MSKAEDGHQPPRFLGMRRDIRILPTYQDVRPRKGPVAILQIQDVEVLLSPLDCRVLGEMLTDIGMSEGDP